MIESLLYPKKLTEPPQLLVIEHAGQDRSGKKYIRNQSCLCLYI